MEVIFEYGLQDKHIILLLKIDGFKETDKGGELFALFLPRIPG